MGVKGARYSRIIVVGLPNFPKTPKVVTVSYFEIDNLEVKIIIL